MSPTNVDTEVRARDRKAIAAREAEKRRRDAAAAEKPQDTLDIRYSTDSLWRYSPLEISFAVIKGPAITGGGNPDLYEATQPEEEKKPSLGRRALDAGKSIWNAGNSLQERGIEALAPVDDLSGQVELGMDAVASRVGNDSRVQALQDRGAGKMGAIDEHQWVDDGDGGHRRERAVGDIGDTGALQRVLGIGQHGKRLVRPTDPIDRQRNMLEGGTPLSEERTGIAGALSRLPIIGGNRKIDGAGNVTRRRLLMPKKPRFVHELQQGQLDANALADAERRGG